MFKYHTSRVAILSAIFLGLAPFASAQTDGYAAGNSGGDAIGWNTAVNSLKWTTDSGSTWSDAASGVTYHTNGFTVRGGRIGVKANAGSPGQSSFAGDLLVVDGYSSASGISSNTGAGVLYFELAATATTTLYGPRLHTTDYHAGEFTANIITASNDHATDWSGIQTTSSGQARMIQVANGVTTLKGSLQLDGNTIFGQKSNDSLFKVDSAVTGTGSILLRDGPSGGSQTVGWATVAFSDLGGWQGDFIKVGHKNTLSFTTDIDFTATNPDAVLQFATTVLSPSNGNPSATLGFLNLSANITILEDHLIYGGAFEDADVFNTITGVTKLGVGVYTAAQLNTYFNVATFASGTGTVTVIAPAAIPEPSTYAAIAGLLVLAGAAYRRRQS